MQVLGKKFGKFALFLCALAALFGYWLWPKTNNELHFEPQTQGLGNIFAPLAEVSQIHTLAVTSNQSVVVNEPTAIAAVAAQAVAQNILQVADLPALNLDDPIFIFSDEQFSAYLFWLITEAFPQHLNQGIDPEEVQFIDHLRQQGFIVAEELQREFLRYLSATDGIKADLAKQDSQLGALYGVATLTKLVQLAPSMPDHLISQLLKDGFSYSAQPHLLEQDLHALIEADERYLLQLMQIMFLTAGYHGEGAEMGEYYKLKNRLAHTAHVYVNEGRQPRHLLAQFQQAWQQLAQQSVNDEVKQIAQAAADKAKISLAPMSKEKVLTMLQLAQPQVDDVNQWIIWFNQAEADDQRAVVAQFITTLNRETQWQLGQWYPLFINLLVNQHSARWSEYHAQLADIAAEMQHLSHVPQTIWFTNLMPFNNLVGQAAVLSSLQRGQLSALQGCVTRGYLSDCSDHLGDELTADEVAQMMVADTFWFGINDIDATTATMANVNYLMLQQRFAQRFNINLQQHFDVQSLVVTTEPVLKSAELDAFYQELFDPTKQLIRPPEITPLQHKAAMQQQISHWLFLQGIELMTQSDSYQIWLDALNERVEQKFSGKTASNLARGIEQGRDLENMIDSELAKLYYMAKNGQVSASWFAYVAE